MEVENSQDIVSSSDNKEAEKKDILLKSDEYIFDMNSLSLPFLAEYRKKRKNEDGKEVPYIIDKIRVKQGEGNVIIVDGGKEFGVPTLYEKNILITIQRMFIKQRMNGGKLQIFKDPDELTTKERTLFPVTIKEIAREMGYSNNPSVAIQLKICDGIRCLNNATYVSKKGKILIKDKKTYLMTAEKGIHLIDDYEIIQFTEAEKDKRKKHVSKRSDNKKASEEYKKKKSGVFNGYVKLTLNPIIYRAMIYDQYLFYSQNKIAEIKNEIEKNIYMLTLKWAGQKKYCKVADETFLEYIIMREDMLPKYKKRAISSAIENLKTLSVVKITDLDNGVRLYNFSNKKNEVLEIKTYMTDRFNNMEDLIAGYIDLGVTEDEISAMVEDLTQKLDFEKLRYYQALLRYVTMMNKYGNISDPRQYILTCIDNNKAVDEKYYNKAIMA